MFPTARSTLSTIPTLRSEDAGNGDDCRYAWRSCDVLRPLQLPWPAMGKACCVSQIFARSLPSGIGLDMFATASIGDWRTGLYGPFLRCFLVLRRLSGAALHRECRQWGQVRQDGECNHEEECKRLGVRHDDEEADPLAAAQPLRRLG